MKFNLKNIRYISTRELKEFLLFYWLIQVIILSIAKYFLVRVGLETGFYRNLILVLLSSFPIFGVLFNIRYIEKEPLYLFMILFFIIVSSVLVTIIIYPDYKYFLFREDYGLIRVLSPDRAVFAFLFFIINDNVKSIYKVLKKFAPIYFLYLLIFSLLPALISGHWVDVDYSGAQVERNYSLTFGYSIAFVAILNIYFYFKEKKFYYLLLFLFAYYLMFTEGSRGSLILPLIFVILYLISGIISSSNSKYKFIKIFFLFISIFLLLSYGEVLIKNLAELLYSFGIKSRNIERIMLGEFSGDTGRYTIWKAVTNGIKRNFISGLGFFGDRPLVFPYHYAAYSHNIFLELISNFGLFGLFYSIILIIISIYMILFSKDANWRELFIVFFSVSLQLILSYSYWYVFEFWAALAIAIRYILLNKN